MINTLRKFFVFTGKRGIQMKKGIFFAVIKSLFDALQVVALSVVLRALVENNVSAKTAWTALGIMLICVLGGIITSHFSRVNENDASFLSCADHRLAIGDRLKYMPMGYFNSNSLGTITSTVTNTMEDIQDIAPRVIDSAMHGFINAAIMALMLTLFDWRIGLIIIGGILLFLLVNHFLQKKANKVSPARVQAQNDIVGAVLEYVQGMSVVRSFNLLLDANKNIDKAIDECGNQNLALELAFIPLICLQSIVLKVVSVVIALASIIFFLAGTMSLTNVILMIVVSFMVYGQLEGAGGNSALFSSVGLLIDRVNAIYTIPLMDASGRAIEVHDHKIIGESVGFSYEDRKIIDDVSFVIPEGKTTAIVGPSGGGKTTLVNLISRFWDVDSGSIKLDGVDLREYTLDSLLKNFSMVFQSVYLFNDTIANNIKFGKAGASQAEIEEAAKKACCHDFIMALPRGYDTVLGEGGATVSGGEKQRISIARAILKDAPIIILDEATANVDPENESKLQEAIAALTKNKTIIMIAHRLKTVRNADQILVLDQGKIVQRGRHEELMKQAGVYKDLVAVREQAIGWKLK